MIGNRVVGEQKDEASKKLKDLYTEEPSYLDIGVTMSSFFVWLGLIYKLVFLTHLQVPALLPVALSDTI
jgi:hypothetical protein